MKLMGRIQKTQFWNGAERMDERVFSLQYGNIIYSMCCQEDG